MRTRRSWRRLVLTVVLMAVAMVLLVVIPVLADVSAQAGNIPSLDVWLISLSGPFAGAVAGVLLSWVIEMRPQYQKLEKRWKRLSFFGVCILITVGSAALRGTLGYVAWSFDPLIWHALWNGFAISGVGTLAHEFLPAYPNEL